MPGMNPGLLHAEQLLDLCKPPLTSFQKCASPKTPRLPSLRAGGRIVILGGPFEGARSPPSRCFGMKKAPNPRNYRGGRPCKLIRGWDVFCFLISGKEEQNGGVGVGGDECLIMGTAGPEAKKTGCLPAQPRYQTLRSRAKFSNASRDAESHIPRPLEQIRSTDQFAH